MATNPYGIQPQAGARVYHSPKKSAVEGGLMGGIAGAQQGSTFGPYGTLIGGAVGLTVGALEGYEQGRLAELAEKNMASQQAAFNMGLKTYNKQDMSQSYITPTQAKMGIKANKYLPAEMETNEIHVDKNYNVKRIGTRSHEQGGNKISLAKGDVVFPTQAKSEQDRILALIKAHKAGYKSATKALEEEKNNLPTPDDLDSMKAEDGIVNSLVPNKTSVRTNALNEPDTNWEDLLPNGKTATDAADLSSSSTPIDWKGAMSTVGRYATPVIDGIGEWSNVAHNISRSNEPILPATRRQYVPQQYRYVDNSGAQRRAVIENRNYMAQAPQQGVDRSVTQGRLNAINTQAMNAMENINAGQAERQNQLSNMNVQQNNQAGLQNLELANQYDMIDRQAKAMQNKYADQAYQDIPKHVQVGRTERYMRSRDKALIDNDYQVLSGLSTGAYEMVPDGVDANGKPRYKVAPKRYQKADTKTTKQRKTTNKNGANTTTDTEEIVE